MDSEQTRNFNERLSQWVANQGFWFQVRYSMSGTGLKGRAMVHLMRLGFRLMIFLLVVAAGSWVYLLKRTDSVRFREQLRQGLQDGLSASELEVRGGTRVQGRLELNRLAAEGDHQTFFSSLEARNIECKMGLLDGLLGVWQPGVVSIAKLDLDLRAGADDAESARLWGEAWFRESDKFEISGFDVAEANLRWGYSERTEGAIEGSALSMQRSETGWRLTFRGGRFQQNWLSELEIVNLVVLSDREGLVCETAEFKRKEGTVDFAGLRVVGGERPQVEGTVRIRHLDLAEILPPAPKRFVEGTLSGDFRVFGSTNSADGIGFEGLVTLDGTDVITLREQIYLLKALSVVDYSRNYHRVDFREGSFQLKTIASGMELTEMKLKADNQFSLEGELKVRLPTNEEVQTAMAQGPGGDPSPIFAGDDLASEGREAAKTESALTLRRAAQEARRIKEGLQNSDSLSLFDRLELNSGMRRLQSHASERLSRMLRYEGELQITIPGDAFERGPKLQERYPVDPATGRIPIAVPIAGYHYELTVKQAEEIYVQGQR